MDAKALSAEIPRLRRYAHALLRDRSAADDLVQDTLERAWQRMSQWQAGSNLAAWLLGIMHNLRVDGLRRRELPLTSLHDQYESTIDLPTRATQTDALEVNDLAAALGKLPEEQREVLLLVALEDMSYAEIASTLGIPQGTVMSRLSRGRERLRQIMAGEPATPTLRVVR